MWTCIKLLIMLRCTMLNIVILNAPVVYAMVSSQGSQGMEGGGESTLLTIPRLLPVSQSVHGSAVLRTHFCLPLYSRCGLAVQSADDSCFAECADQVE